MPSFANGFSAAANRITVHTASERPLLPLIGCNVSFELKQAKLVQPVLNACLNLRAEVRD